MMKTSENIMPYLPLNKGGINHIKTKKKKKKRNAKQ